MLIVNKLAELAGSEGPDVPVTMVVLAEICCGSFRAVVAELHGEEAYLD